MKYPWLFIFGLAVLVLLGAVIGHRLGPEYRRRLRPSLPTVVMVWIFYAVHFTLVVLAALWSIGRFSLPSPVTMGGGVALIVVGSAIYLSATYTFGGWKRQSGLDNTRLVTEGIYGWSRNPLFVGWAFVLLGLGLTCESAMVLFLTLCYWVSYRLTLPLEEELLGSLFGDAYARYRQRTHRYFGPPGRSPEMPPDAGVQPTPLGGG